jgi:hypothetical protein
LNPSPSTRVKVAATLGSLLVLCAQYRSSGAQDWRSAVQGGLITEPVLGLLDLPDVISSECSAPAPLASADLYRQPARSDPPLASIQQSPLCQVAMRRGGAEIEEELPTAESGYERPAAIVLERDDVWFRIALQQGSAWIERKDPDDFLRYPDLLKDRLTYLGMGWDGRLWETPGASDATPLQVKWRSYLTSEVPIEFLDSMRVGNQTWIQVRLGPSERCGEALEGVDPVTGWVPAHRPSGVPSAWFYSRGC